MAQLDQVPVTRDNADEVAEIRAKLAQTGITQSDFLLLKARVSALESLVTDWSKAVPIAQRAVYAVLHAVFVNQDDVEITFLATAFAVDGQRLITNGHVVDGLLELDESVRQFNARFDNDLQTEWIVVQNLTTSLVYKQNYFSIGKYREHPGWVSGDVNTPDVGYLVVSEGTLPRQLELLSAADALRVKAGDAIATLGFPGELQGGNLENLFPIGTLKVGIVSALRPAQQGTPYTVRDTYIVQHNLDLSGGTSGSPIFSPAGKVIAVNNAGMENLVLTVGGTPARVSQASLGFGIRADKIQELLAKAVLAKPAALDAGTRRWPQLEGKSVADLHTEPSSADLAERLERYLEDQ